MGLDHTYAQVKIVGKQWWPVDSWLGENAPGMVNAYAASVSRTVRSSPSMASRVAPVRAGHHRHRFHAAGVAGQRQMGRLANHPGPTAPTSRQR